MYPQKENKQLHYRCTVTVTHYDHGYESANITTATDVHQSIDTRPMGYFGC